MLDIILVMINLFMMLIPIALALHVATAPHSPMYLSSLVPENQHVILALISLGYWTMVTQSSILFSTHLQAIFTHVLYGTPIMSKDLRADINKIELNITCGQETTCHTSTGVLNFCIISKWIIMEN